MADIHWKREKGRHDDPSIGSVMFAKKPWGKPPGFSNGDPIVKPVLTPMKAIRAKCLDCSCGQVKEIRECPVKNCALWPYRMGRRPTKQMKTDST